MRTIAFFGLGSIAKRHIRNLSVLLNQNGEEYTIDVYRHTLSPIEDDDIIGLVDTVYSENQLELNDMIYDIIFVTNPTSKHFETIKKCVPYAKNIFIEKPVFSDCEEDISKLELKNDAVYYVACPLRYSAVFSSIMKVINLEDVFSVRAISSSYLPEWREGIDYRKSYSAHKAMGGGVGIDLVHEWDYLVALFGLPKQVVSVSGKFSNLEIDSDDIAAYLGVYDDKIIEVHLDYFGRETIRECVFYTKDDTVVADFISGQIRFLKEGKIVDVFEERNSFMMNEIMHFLDIVDGKCENDSTIEHAVKILRISLGKGV